MGTFIPFSQSLDCLWFFLVPCKIFQSKPDSIRLQVCELASLHKQPTHLYITRAGMRDPWISRSPSVSVSPSVFPGSL